MIAYAKCFEYANTKMSLSISYKNSFSVIIAGSLSGLNVKDPILLFVQDGCLPTVTAAAWSVLNLSHCSTILELWPFSLIILKGRVLSVQTMAYIFPTHILQYMYICEYRYK